MQTLDKLLTFYLKSVATPHCLSILADIKEQQWARLVNRKVSPGAYASPHLYLADAQAQAFFSKNASLAHPDLDPKAEAQKSWYESEHRNARTNAMLQRLQMGPNVPEDLPLIDFLFKVKKRISHWLGPLPTELHSKFGPGVTLCCESSTATVADKMTISPTTTSSAWYLAKQTLPESAWFRSLIVTNKLNYVEGSLSGAQIVRSGRWTCVPKNAKTHRGIEIGPNINVALQLFVGNTMKKRFAAKGWDLLNAADSHRAYARDSSLTGSHATIDLKQASDSVSKRLVECLLPTPWFDLLDQLRTKSILFEGKTVHLEKFSGMGNGYTFELESLIFMAISQEVCAILGLPATAGKDVLVFGDDIIVPDSASNLLIKVLSRLGFETNVDKTFVKGPFRESCGGDFFSGMAVRPFFLKESPNEPQDWIALANGIRRMVDDHSVPDWLRRIYNGCWILALRAIPSAIRKCRGPSELGDIVIHDTQSKWTTRTRNCIRSIRVYKPVARLAGLRDGGSVVEWDNFPDSVKLATVLLGQGVARIKRDYSSHERPYKLVDLGIIPRRPRLSLKFGWVTYS